MRPPFYLTLILALALAAFGWRNQCRIRDLETQQIRVSEQARAAGWLVDGRAPDGVVRSSGRARPDRAAAAKQAAAALVSYAREFPRLDPAAAGGKQQRVLLETERIQQLDGSQLKVVIGELRAATDLEDGIRDSLLTFTLTQLAQSHPRDALAHLIDPGCKRIFDDLLPEVMKEWSKTDPLAASEWLRQHPNQIPEERLPAIKDALVKGAAASDPALALQWLGEKGGEPRVSELLSGIELTTAQRLAFLSAFRSWRSTPAGSALTRLDRMDCLTALVFGNDRSRRTHLSEVAAFLADAKPQPEEFDDLTLTELIPRIRPEEAAAWFEWAIKNLPEKEAARWQKSLLGNSATSAAVTKWLASQAPEMRRRWLDEAGNPIRESPPPGGYPVATPAPGRPGFVLSPYSNKLIDVRDVPSGKLVRDPASPDGGIFRVP